MLSQTARDSGKVLYEGPIRAGGAKSGTVSGYSVKLDEETGVAFLDPLPTGLDTYYAEDDYWAGRYGDGSSVNLDSLRQKLGREQGLWLNAIGPENLAGRRVLDVGAGAGLFLDRLLEISCETLGVEPSAAMRQTMAKRSHEVYERIDAVEDSSVDVCVSFDTLEHVPDPISFLEEVYRILKPGGRVHIGVPNQDDGLKDICPAYLPFFYHLSHLYYFSANSLSGLLLRVGFSNIQVGSVHKYNFMNLVNWLHDGKATGVAHGSPFDSDFEAAFCEGLERQTKASHILLKAVKGY